jgi:peptide/nickel transport system substrate-binding protein
MFFRRGRRPRRVFLAVSTILCATTLSACGGGSTAASNGYVIVIPQDFQGVDRAKYSSEASKILADIMHSRLLEMQTDGSSPTACTGGVPPKLKESSPLVQKWSLTSDGKGIDITLRPNVKSAAGKTLTSADVAWSIDRIKAIDTSAKLLWFSIGGFDVNKPITVKSPSEFTLNLTKRSELAPYALAGVAGLILDSGTAKAHATASDPWATKYLTDHTADFGPWTLSSFSPQQLTFAKNPNYTGVRGNLNKIVVRTVSEASSRIQLIQSGQAAETTGLDFTQLESLKHNSSVDLVSCDNPARDWLGLNTKDPVLGKKEVRQAISYALDRSAIQTAVYRGFAKPAAHAFSQVFPAADDGSAYRYDVAKAKQLLKQAGVAGGFNLDLSVSAAQPGPYSQNLALLIQQQLKQVGINVRVKTVPSAVQFKADGTAHKMQAWLMGETPAFGNVGYSGWLTMGCKGLQNYMGYCDGKLDQLAEQLQANAGGKDADSRTRQLAATIADEQPAVYLIDRSTVNIRNTCVTSVPSSAFTNDYTEAAARCQ